jgi:hypothetical protein
MTTLITFIGYPLDSGGHYLLWCRRRRKKVGIIYAQTWTQSIGQLRP